MEDILNWLEGLKTATVSETYRENVKNLEEDLKTYNRKFENVQNLEQFTKLEVEVTEKCTLAFATRKQGYILVPNSSNVLIENADWETKTGLKLALQREKPETAIRYHIYDVKARRIRKRLSTDENLSQSLKVVHYNNADVDQFIDDITTDLKKKLARLKEKGKTDNTVHVIKCLARLNRLEEIRKIQENFRKVEHVN